MRYRNRISGTTAETDRPLSYPWEREHDAVGCWCEPVPEQVCHCGRVFGTANGLAQHQRMVHAE